MSAYQDLPEGKSSLGAYGDIPEPGKIPGAGGAVAPPPAPEMAGEPSYGKKALMYAQAVPAAGLFSQLAKRATAGTKVAPYTSQLAEVLTPKTLPQLVGATGVAAASAIPAEFARKTAETAGAGPGGQTLAEMLGGSVVAAPSLAVPYLSRQARTALGGETKQAAGALKTRAEEQLQASRARAEQERERYQRAITQMERQPVVAGERAARAPLTPEQEVASLQAQVRQPVREKLGARRVTEEERLARAEAGAAQAEQSTLAAQRAVDQIEQSLLSRPTTTAEQFGAQIRQATTRLQQEALRNRAEQSNLSAILRESGAEPNISTAPLIARTQELAKQSRNPQVLAMLSEVESLAKTGDKAVLTLQQADSLRKYLNKDIIGKFFAQMGADKETLRTLRSLRGALIQSTPDNYRKALGEFSVLSRPLDIVERQGALKRVLDIDPMSTAEKLTEAQVVGEVIKKAAAGNPVFTRLLESSPNLREAGRLFFTQDLFGKGVVPTEASVRTWLQANERPLRQLGLYDEFSNLKRAREAAQIAVDNAKLSATQAKKVAATAAERAAEAKKLSEESASRLGQALQTAQGPAVRPGETLADALRRTRTGEKPAPVQTFVGQREKQQTFIEEYTQLINNLAVAKSSQDIRSVVERSANKLLKDGIIDPRTHRQMLVEIEKVKGLEEARDKARKIMGGVAAAVGVTYMGRRTFDASMGGQ